MHAVVVLHEHAPHKAHFSLWGVYRATKLLCCMLTTGQPLSAVLRACCTRLTTACYPIVWKEGTCMHAYLKRAHGATPLAHICVHQLQPPLFTVWVLRVWTMLEKYMPIWLEWEVPCICIYIYIYIHLYRYIYIYIYLYLYTYTYTQTWLRHMLQLNMYIYISSGHAFRQSCRRICYAIIIRLHTNWKCHRAIYNLKSVCL